MSAEQIAAVRRLNRLVTLRAGALDDHFLGRGRPLGASRVLYEVGEHGAALRELRDRLGLDAGYLSRLIAALRREGLVELERAGADRRIRMARLTRAGRREVREMNRRSDRAAAALLATFPAAQRERLVGAMDEVHRLLRLAGLRIERTRPASPRARQCVARYYAELDRRFDAGFDPGASLPADARDLAPPIGVFLVGSIDGEPVACGAVKTIAPGIGSLKRMWVSGDVRGQGIGRRMLEALEAEARSLGLGTLRLETNRALAEAVSLYRKAGYREVARFNDDPYAHHWFEKRILPG